MANTNNIKKLLTSLLGPVQDMENALQTLFTERGIDYALGEQLDVLGRVVGQPRNGLEDEIYRRYIRARITANRSKGTINEITRIADLIVYEDGVIYQVDNQGMACYVIRPYAAISAELAATLLLFEQDATSAGVRVIVEYSSLEPETWFRWDTTGVGWDEGYFIDAID